jgi:hypothetical protein
MNNILKQGIDFKWSSIKNGFGVDIICPITNDGYKMIPISEPSKNSVVYEYNEETEELKPVLILEGCWLSNGRLSNWWEWQVLNNNLELCERKSGYGRFYKPQKVFRVNIKYEITA